MRCNCCDEILSKVEATARFATAKDEPLRYVEMCTQCQSFLPPGVRIITRPDLHKNNHELDYTEDHPDDYFDLGDYDTDD